MTHSGTLHYSHSNKTKIIKLRETKLYWIDEKDKRFKKSNGVQVIGEWFYFYLDIKTVKPL